VIAQFQSCCPALRSLLGMSRQPYGRFARPSHSANLEIKGGDLAPLLFLGNSPCLLVSYASFLANPFAARIDFFHFVFGVLLIICF
jgi:hypothetical protein